MMRKAEWGSWEAKGPLHTCEGFPLYRWREKRRWMKGGLGRCGTVSDERWGELFVKQEHESIHRMRWIV